MSGKSLSVRARVAVAGITLAGLGIGVAPLAGAASAAPSVPASAAGVPVLKVAAAEKGVPYRWGGTSTRGFDCSGYVQFVFKQLGVKLPRTAEQQYEATRHLTRSQLKVGDLVFFGGPGWVYHVGIYAGNNTFWNAPHTGDRVRLMKIWAGRKVYGRVRGLPSSLTVAPASVAPGVVLPIVVAAPLASTDPASSAPATPDPAATATASAAPATPAAAAATPTPTASTTASPAVSTITATALPQR